MKGIVYTEYGPPEVLRFAEIAKPELKAEQVLIKVRAAAVNALDWRLMRGTPYLVRIMTGGLRKPKNGRPGVDVAGEVEAVGAKVNEFKPGDEVFGFCEGSLAEYACTVEEKLVSKPANVSFEQAAATPLAAISALQALRDKGRIQAGQKVLIDGASGGVGSFAVQIARVLGGRVTAVCSTGNVETARASGAERVIDYTREDFTQGAERYDLIVGANAHHPILHYRRVLAPAGRYVVVGGGGSQMLQTLVGGPLLSLFSGRKLGFVMARSRKADLVLLRDWLAAGTLVPVIARRYPLSEGGDAVGYVDAGHARGKAVVTVEHPGDS